MRPVTVTIGALAMASANAIATSQTLGSAGSLTLNGSTVSGGVSTLDMPRRVAITSAGNDSGITFTVTGTDRYGKAQSESIVGGNAAAVSSVLDYARVTSIAASGATAAAVQAGTNATASSSWVRNDEYAAAPLGGQISAISGTPTWILEGSFDDPNSPTNPVPPALMNWIVIHDSTAGPILNTPSAPLWARATMTGGTGALRATFVQYAEVSHIQP